MQSVLITVLSMPKFLELSSWVLSNSFLTLVELIELDEFNKILAKIEKLLCILLYLQFPSLSATCDVSKCESRCQLKRRVMFSGADFAGVAHF